MKKLFGLIQKYRLQGIIDVLLFAGILLFFHFLYRGNRDIFTHWSFYKNSSEFLSNTVFHWVDALVSITRIPFESFEHLTRNGSIFKRAFLYYGSLNYGIIYVSWGCSGLKQFYQWVFLIALFPGPWKHKLWYIPMGIGVIFLVNVLRIYSLLIVTMYSPSIVHFFHDDIVRPFFYVVMFALWVIWNERFTIPMRKKRELNRKAGAEMNEVVS